MTRTRRGTAHGAEALPLHMSFRLSPDLRDRLADAAGDRPIGDEIRQRLDRSFTEQPAAASADPRFGDLLAAIGYAASAAAQSTDPAAYDNLEWTVTLLFEAFRQQPPMAPNHLPPAAERLAFMALGRLGDRGATAFARLNDDRLERVRAEVLDRVEMMGLPASGEPKRQTEGSDER
jgi:hypothetical protein